MKHLKRFNESISSTNLTLDDIKHNLEIYKKVSEKYPIIEDPQNKVIKDSGLHWTSHKLKVFGSVDIDKINKSNMNKDEFIDFIKNNSTYSKDKFNKDMDDKKLFYQLESIYIEPSFVNEMISFYINNPGKYSKLPINFQKVDMTSDDIISKLDKTTNKLNELGKIKEKLKSLKDKYDLTENDIMDLAFELKYELFPYKYEK